MNGNVLTWGLNDAGQLGDGSVTSRLTPVRVLNNGNPHLKIKFATLDRDGTSQTVRIYDGAVLLKDDTVVSALQVGDVVNIDKSKILGNEAFNVLRDSGYAPNTLEFTSLNEKVATVDKNTGKISLLRTGLAYIVVKDTEKGGVGYIKINVIPKNSNFIANPVVKAGHAFTLALKADGTVWSFGDNSVGQLGNGTVGGNSEFPVQVMRLEIVLVRH